ncbi:MAG: hypothetical protein JOS17DRAFT_791374 [Linnemannia elongata]|nr:MAG: hypothetical protein JOS17DRAFT_791374 [Linnemannia elongata]
MVISLFLLTAFLKSFAFANYYVAILNNAHKSTELMVTRDRRTCVCLKSTQTARILNYLGGDVKLFSKSGCTGKYATLDADASQYNAQWVNSVSFGKSGIPSYGPEGCPNRFA